ncbi:hypothetical protein KUTeg_007721 [Tegillarca granosa]|uniref:Activating molecule in BECN1-regulated autophagy protein 1 n=1 Tax=Tegillarca granosa TaxID=220873 RepID=A0ABQ9FG08_TEGGR|nr:hypothetical protein KUTeg_007721 [Tegillarca granosa]
MSCLIPFLRKRELGQRDTTLKYKSEVCDLVEEYGAYPVKNEPCKLSRQCRATFLTDFSPDGKRIASTHGDHTVRVTEIATRKCTHVLHGHPRTPWCLAFHPSSNDILASGCLGGEVRIWDLHGGGSEVWRSKDNLVIASLTFHPTDFVLVFAVGNTLYFWDWSKSEPWVRFDPLGNNLLTGITNSTTLHQTNPSRVSYINTERQNAVNRTQSQPQSQNRLSSVYDNLVECFHAYRRERGYEPSNVLGPSGASEREPSSQLLENALRTSPPQVHQPAQQQQQQQIGDRYLDDNFGANSWHSLQRHHLHPHYAVSILDDTINRPNDALQTAINRAIAGAFMGRGEQAVANNIINQTHRIQMWDFSKCEIPDITDRPNAISVSLSPRNHYVMVGLAAKRLSWVFTAKQLVSRIYKLEKENAGEKSMKHVTDVMHPCDTDVRTHVSVNSARWLRGVGEGIVYGTNRGDLHICKPGSKIAADGEKTDDPNISGTSIRRNLMHMLGLSAGAGPLISIATQTSGVRRSAATQTDMEEQTTE